MSGSCTLVGAGPGDPDLLTLKAVKAIQAATVLFVDDLVSEAIVALAPAAARQGEAVVRLKGGDPFIFGRGGEEVEHLAAAGIAVQVVNGITAGLAGMTLLGAPLTHRQHAHGVVFITGHHQPGGHPTNWRQLAATARDARLTLVIYMGVKSCAYIQAELLTALPAHTPAAVIQHASLPQQRHAITTLGQLRQTIEREALASPSIIVIGDVLRGLAAAAQASGAG